MHRGLRCSKVRALSQFEFDSMLASDSTKTNQCESLLVEELASDLGNSDRIRLKFGNYGIEVVENGLRIRVSNLYSVAEGIKTNRTFAVVMYPAVIDPAFSIEHDAIIKGQSIGIVFREHGWLIEKRHQHISELETTSDLSGIRTVFGDIGTSRPVVHVYSLFIKKHNTEFHYASIAEVHHPDYLDFEELKAIYGNEFDDTPAEDQDIIDVLEIVKARMQGT